MTTTATWNAKNMTFAQMTQYGLMVFLRTFSVARGKMMSWTQPVVEIQAVGCLFFHVYYEVTPVKNVTWIFACLRDGSLVGNETKPDGNPIIVVANVMT